MMERSEQGLGFSVLDGTAIVIGAAVALIHIPGGLPDDRAARGWVLIGAPFAWLAWPAAGPFLFLIRRFVRRPLDSPKVGDVLWAVLGLPWLLTAVIRSAIPRVVPGRDALFAVSLGLGLAF